MRLSAPVHSLKRQARMLSRNEKIPLHQALDRIAAGEGFAGWSLLAAKAAAVTPAGRLFARLVPGDLVLVAARPGQRKTLMGLELAVEAMKAGHRGVFFTLEYTARDVSDRFAKIGADFAEFRDRFECDDSDAIDAAHIIARLETAPAGTLAVIDYLQLLDQRRQNPELTVQVRALRELARRRGLVLVFLSQVHRSYDATTKPFPDVTDVRLPNPLDMTLFSKLCFLNDRKVRFRAA